MEQIANVTERFEQGIEGSGSDAPQTCLELRECHFDRIEIRAKELATMPSQGLRGARAFVGGQVVEDDSSSGIERRGQLRFNVDVEGRPVHGSDDHTGPSPIGIRRCVQSMDRSQIRRNSFVLLIASNMAVGCK